VSPRRTPFFFPPRPPPLDCIRTLIPAPRLVFRPLALALEIFSPNQPFFLFSRTEHSNLPLYLRSPCSYLERTSDLGGLTMRFRRPTSPAQLFFPPAEQRLFPANKNTYLFGCRLPRRPIEHPFWWSLLQRYFGPPISLPVSKTPLLFSPPSKELIFPCSQAPSFREVRRFLAPQPKAIQLFLGIVIALKGYLSLLIPSFFDAVFLFFPALPSHAILHAS